MGNAVNCEFAVRADGLDLMDSSVKILLAVLCLVPIGYVLPLYFRLPPPWPPFNPEDDFERTDPANDTNQEWNYMDFQAWKTYKSCGGRYQSPVNIDTNSVKPKNYTAISFRNYEVIDKPMTITNNGHTVLLHLPDGYLPEDVPHLQNGGLDSQYNFVQLHFHWGSDNSQGSEHQINNRTYPAEIHVVHYNDKYGDFSEASHHADGLAVLGILVELGPEDNRHWAPILDKFKYISAEDTEVTLDIKVSLKDLLPVDTSNFYRYFGSLTTPGCQEIVTWTIFDTPIIISENQILRFRQLSSKSPDGHLINNHRPIQQLADRVVYHRQSD